MKQIDYCSTVSDDLKKHLKDIGIINGCGGKGGFSFDRFYEDYIENHKNFLPEKAEELKNNISELCCTHDLLFSIFKGRINFVLANFVFVKDIFKLLNWVGLYSRLIIVSIMFILLCVKGYKYYLNK